MTTAHDQTVDDALSAIGRGALLPLLALDQARLLGPLVARVEAGLELDDQARASARMLLHNNRSVLAAPLAHLGAAVPELNAPPPPRPSRATGARRITIKLINLRGQARIGAFGGYLKPLMEPLTGVRYDAERQCWHVPASPAAAHAVLSVLGVQDPLVSRGVTELAEQFEQTRSARAILADGAPLPDGDLSDVVTVAGWDHQRRGVAFTEAARALLLAVPMGGGKTIMTIAGLNRRQAARVLIVGPDAARAVWPREAREKSAVSWHCEDGTRPSKVKGGKRVKLSAPERLERMQRVLWGCECGAPVHAFAINYEVMATPPWRKWRPPHPLDAIVYDEVHKLKSPTGVVSKVAAKWHGYAELHIGLSGTPLPQSPLDAFGVMRALDPGLFGTTWTAFKARYAVMDPTGTFPLTGRIQNGEELARKFMSITYRPEIDLNLPPVTDIERPVELEPAAQKVYDDLDEALWADLTPFLAGGQVDLGDPRTAELAEQVAAAVAATGGPLGSSLLDAEDADGTPSEITAPNVLTRLLRLQQLTGGTLRDDEGVAIRVSRAKEKAVAAWLADEVVLRRGSGDPVVMFCRFRSDLDVIAALAEEFGVRYGEISGRAKTGLDDDARMHPECDLVGVQIQSGGTGIDLTRARFGGWYSLGYSLSDYDQARKRLDRPGQTRPVVFAHFVTINSADQAVYDAMASRRAVISAVLRQGGVDPAALGIVEPVPDPSPDHGSPSGRGGAVELPWD